MAFLLVRMSICYTSIAERTRLQSRKRNREMGKELHDNVSVSEEIGVSGKELHEIVVDDYVTKKNKEMGQELHDEIIIVVDDDLMQNKSSKTTSQNDKGNVYLFSFILNIILYSFFFFFL